MFVIQFKHDVARLSQLPIISKYIMILIYLVFEKLTIFEEHLTRPILKVVIGAVNLTINL